MEDDEDNPLVSDPLAAPLAGRKALAAARARRQPAPAGGGRAFKVGAMAVRTRWFDDQLEACLGMPLGAAAAAAAAGDYIVAAPPPGRAPRQVVVLGAGMDSRPWRLKLPAGLAWFEVDRADVLAAKQAALGAAGAELGAPPTPSMRRGYSSNALLEAKIGSMDHHPTAAVAHPLRAESWVGVAADLGDPAWAQALAAAGFEPGKPTVWIAEGCDAAGGRWLGWGRLQGGALHTSAAVCCARLPAPPDSAAPLPLRRLLMYLEAARVSALLQEVAASSAPGSALLTMSVTEDVITDLREQGTASELMATWRFGCPRDPTQASASWGGQLMRWGLVRDQHTSSAVPTTADLRAPSPPACPFSPCSGW
jgi:O-methyltransferase involved in polyketide biosynthesis